MGQSDGGAQSSMKRPAETSYKEFAEEWKLVLLVLTVASTLGATIAFSMGGGAVLRSWIAPVSKGCSVSDLHKIEGSFESFHCKDGFLDLSQQTSFMTKGGVMIKTYSAYRIAPVYSSKPS